MAGTFRVTKNFSDDEARVSGSNGSSATLSWTVTGTSGTVADVVNALRAVDDTDSTIRIPQIGEPYDAENIFFRCGDVVAKKKSPGIVGIVATFGVSVPTAPNPNPISDAVVVTSDEAECEEEVDHDIDGNPIRNLAGSFMPGARRSVTVSTVTLLKNLSAFPAKLAKTYRNSVNNDDFTLPIIGPVKASYARFVSLVPAAPVRVNDPYFPMKLTLQIYSEDAPEHPWQHRMLNQGPQCWGHNTNDSDTTPVLGDICYFDTGQPVCRDVLLDIDGVPFAEVANVTGITPRYGKAPLDSFDPAPMAADIVNSMKIKPDESLGNAVFLRYRRRFQRPFKSLISALNMNS